MASILAVQLAAMAAVPPANAASILWTVTASPLAATTGVQRVFTLTATNEDPLAALLSSSEIGCVVTTVPGNFSVAGAGVTGSNTGGSWQVASIAGNTVTVRTNSGGDRLALLDWVRFTITATATSTGSVAWQAKAYRQQDCTGSAALLGIPPIVVVTGPAVTPTPAPTPPPTPKPTPTPTLRPSPLPSLPLPSVPLPLPSGEPPVATPAPSQRPSATGRPAPTPASSSDPAATPGGTPGASSGEPQPSADTGADTGAGTSGPGTGGGDGPGGGTAGPLTPPTEIPVTAPRVAFDEGRLDLGSLGIDLIGDIAIWSVPAATLGVPGIILIVWVALQAAGALAWIPAVRSLRGEES